jgi:DNA-binding transcriptional MerR regulator
MENGSTVEQVAKTLNVSTKSIRNYIKKGLLSATLNDGKLYISLESIRNFPSKKHGKVETEKNSISKVTIELSYLEGLLTRNAQLEVQAQALLEHKAGMESLTRQVTDLEAELQKERSKGFWSRLFR